MPTRATLAVAIAMACTSCLLAAPARAANITRTDWGVTPEGQKVDLFTLTGAGGLTVRITDFGGVIVSVMAPDRNGQTADVVLGEDDLAGYEKGGPAAAVIGRYANRIGSNGTFPLDGKTIQLERTAADQKIVIHGGTAPFARKVWKAVMHDGTEPRLTLSVVSPDGDGGFPGTLTATVTYTVTKNHALRLDYRARTDKPTVVNLTNHAYFSLGGEGRGNVLDQRLRVYADRYTVFDADGLPTGQIAPVAGTPLDFAHPVRVGDIVDSTFVQIAQRKGLDVNLIVNGQTVQSQSVSDSPSTINFTLSGSGSETVAVQVIDSVLYDAQSPNATINFGSTSSGPTNGAVSHSGGSTTFCP